MGLQSKVTAITPRDRGSDLSRVRRSEIESTRPAERGTFQFEPLLDSREAAALLRMHYKTVERKARNGEIPRYHHNGGWYFRASELDAWLRSAVHSLAANPSA
jgi:excisionase family DNA binding protein